MKSNFIRIFLIFFFSCIYLSNIQASDFNFKVTEIDITNDGNLYNGRNGGVVTTNDGLKVISDSFQYNKITNELEAFGNVELYDEKKNMTILTNKITYLKNEEKIFTHGKTEININNEYNIFGKDFFLFRKTMYLSSKNESSVKDILLNNFYILDNFTYSINEKILKGNDVIVTTKQDTDKSDKYFFETGFFDFNNQEFLAKDVRVMFNKKSFDNEKNDPRLTGITGSGDEFNTYLDKGTFTTCKKNNDKCPPWRIESKKVRHDKVRKQIVYNQAWLKVYNVPVSYFPKFFHPDPTVKRQSGFLKPSLGSSTALGESVYTPYFWAIAEDKDMTFKPRAFGTDKYVLQSEYRQETKRSNTIMDFSLARGHDSSSSDKGDNRSHFFSKTNVNLGFDNFLRSDLEIQYQKASNDTYLKLFNLFEAGSPLKPTHDKLLTSKVKLDLEADNYNFVSSIQQFETLDGNNSDRYQYILPQYDFSTNFYLDNFDIGGFSFTSSGANNLYNTNVLTTTVNNNLNFSTYDNFFDSGIKNNFVVSLKNLNSIGKNSPTYKTSPQSELMSNYMYNASYTLIKDRDDTFNTLIPKLSLRFSPHEMKNHRNSERRVDVDSIFNLDRLGLGDSYEEGGSLTLGIDYTKQKQKTNEDDSIQIEDFFEMKIATVIRNKEENKIPFNSSLSDKQSNLVGKIGYSFLEYFNLDYDFSVKDDFKTFEYNAIETSLSYSKFYTGFTFVEETGRLGNSNVIKNTSKYSFDNSNSVQFNTRRNRKTSLTEYYDLVYKYENDCLTASLEYKKNYYNDKDIRPTEELFFSITIVPLTTLSPSKLTELVLQ
tara:strand:+ start:2830 stop:5304 length:2475 start_codon:yes stop_codon:yes gene_type:complete